MSILQALMTRGALVRVPSGRHAMIESFDMRLNMATLSFADGGDDSEVHLTKLRAGDEESEKAFGRAPSSDFPKFAALPGGLPGMARKLRRRPRWDDAT